MTREEALKMIPEGYGECSYDEYIESEPCWRCGWRDGSCGQHRIYARLIPEPEPKSVTFEAVLYRQETEEFGLRDWGMTEDAYRMLEVQLTNHPKGTPCKVTVEWTPKRGEK